MTKKDNDQLRRNGLKPVHLVKAERVPAALATASPEQIARNCPEEKLLMALDIQKLQKAFWRKSPNKNIITTDDADVIALYNSGKINAIINERIIPGDPASIPTQYTDEAITTDCNNGQFSISSAAALRWMVKNGVKFIGDEDFLVEGKTR